MEFVEILKHVFLGIIQGFTEPIPVSSSGHLVILREFLTSDVFRDLNFEIIVNFGSLLAIMFLYKKDISKIFKEFFLYIKTKEKKYRNNFNYFLYIVIATIPAGIIGLLFKDFIEEKLVSVKIVGIALLITALFLFLIRNKEGKKTSEKITWKDSIVIGLFQAVALLPGISRSGATIVGGMFRDFKREVSVKFSFMLYIPISIATSILGVSDIIDAGNVDSLIVPYSLGMIASAIVTYFAAKWFINIMKKGDLVYFVSYCLILGITVLLFV